jgi:molecular chaperone GrpE
MKGEMKKKDKRTIDIEDRDRAAREADHEEHDELRVSDRRRFGPNGSRRSDPEDEPEANPEPTVDEAPPPAEEVVPAGVAREWERRALEAEGRIRDVADAYRRQKLEMERVRARLERDQEARVREVVGRTFLRILDSLDHLELALSHAEEGPLVEGLRLVHRKMLDALATEGLERIQIVGEPFDPEVAEAVAMVPVEDTGQNGRVVSEMRPGYRFEGQVLRPAQVHVGTATGGA